MVKEVDIDVVEAITTLVQFNNKAFATFEEFLNKVEEHAKKNRDSKLQKMVDDVEKKYETYNKEMEEKRSKLTRTTEFKETDENMRLR